MKKKEEILEELKKAKGVLNSEMMEYLNCIANLEFSVIKDGIISNSQREVLSNLEIYRQLAAYNIYQRAINLLRGKDANLDLKDRENYLVIERKDNYNLNTQLSLKEVFSFIYNRPQPREDYIGNITLFNAADDQKTREMQQEYLMYKLYDLMTKKDIINNYIYDDRCELFCIPNGINQKCPQWEIVNIEKQIKDLEAKFNKLDKCLSDEERKSISLLNEFYSLLVEDYGLTDQVLNDNNTVSNYTLIKKMPGINIQKRTIGVWHSTNY